MDDEGDGITRRERKNGRTGSPGTSLQREDISKGTEGSRLVLGSSVDEMCGEVVLVDKRTD